MRAAILSVLTVLPVLGTADIAVAQPVPEAAPCASDPLHGALDFWVGEWEVFVGDRRVGTNRIEKTLDGCLVIEHWTSATGRAGKSVNFVHPGSGSWRQVWVSQSGEVVLYEGKPSEGGMRFEGEAIGNDGHAIPARAELTTQPDGRVRQRIERSPDGGASWEIYFDAVYVRVGSASLP